MNNLALFQKSEEGERQFSNIISGAIKAGDKLFAYIPFRPITLREKSIRAVLVKNEQGTFANHLAQLAGTNGDFTCCGVHVAIEQIKEIPLESPQVAVLASSPPPKESPKPIAAELSVGTKRSALGTAMHAVIKSRARIFMATAAVILIPLITTVAIRSSGESGSTRALIEQAVKNIQIAEEKIAKSDSRGARSLLWETLALLATTQGATAADTRIKASGILDALDHVSPSIPQKSSVAWKSHESLSDVHAHYDDNLYVLKDSVITKNSKAWSKTPIPDDGIAMAIDGNIYVFTKGGILMTYFLGEKKAEVATELEVLDARMAVMDDRKAEIVYIADSSRKRIYAVSKLTGAIVTTYKADLIPSLQEISVDSDGDLYIFDGADTWTMATQ